MKTSVSYKVLLFVLIVFQGMAGHAQWSHDPAENNLVIEAEQDQKNNCIVYDGKGNVIIGWRDLQYTSNTLVGGEFYVQKINAGGERMWPQTGTRVSTVAGEGYAHSPGLIKSGEGKVIAVWVKWGSSYYDPTRIYAQKLDEDASPLWENDIRLFDLSGGQGWYNFATDHNGGVVVTCLYADGLWSNTPKDVIAQRINASGKVMWTSSGIKVCEAAGNQLYADVTCTPQGYCYIVWQDKRDDSSGDIYAQMIDTAGGVHWLKDGIPVCDNTNGQEYPVVTSDGNSGAIIAWREVLPGSGNAVYAQRVNASGALLWGENGVLVCESIFCSAPSITGDGNGGAVIVWSDGRGEDPDIYARRIDSSGAVHWDDNGIPVTQAPGTQSDFDVIPDGNGGVIVAWNDFRDNPDFGDIYAQHIDGNGKAAWRYNGVAVSTAESQQLYPSLAATGEGGTVIVWDDMRREGNHYDIYAQYLDAGGYVGAFMDQDHDGIDDREERGPQGSDTLYDGNGDQIPDGQQGHVASFYTYDQQHYVTLSVPDSLSLENVRALDNPAPEAPGQPAGAEAPYGFFSFTITGLTAGSHTVATLVPDGGETIDRYYKYGPLPGQESRWYEFDWDGETGAVISGDTVKLYLTDGKRGDHDLTADGVIIEPGGPLRIATFAAQVMEETFCLKKIQPNPVRETTTIVFEITETCTVRIELYDILGRQVKLLLNEFLPAGEHRLTWHRGNMPQGIFLLKMTAGDRFVVGKVVVER